MPSHFEFVLVVIVTIFSGLSLSLATQLEVPENTPLAPFFSGLQKPLSAVILHPL